MEQELFTIEDCFKIFGQGVAIVGKDQLNFQKINIGTFVVLFYPNGTEIITEISGIERIQTVSGIKKTALLIKNVAKEHIPVGTKVLLDI
jgi:hypothetical protein